MKTYLYPPPSRWAALLRRPPLPQADLQALVADAFDQVRSQGDKAVLRMARQYDGWQGKALQVPASELQAAGKQLSPTLRRAIRTAAANISQFHKSQRQAVRKVSTQPGVTCWRESRPIPRVGLYVPGGTAPLFSTVLMLAIPARLAGCEEVILCTPPDAAGKVHPAILHAAQLTGVTQVFCLGGIQAIAAMALGTASVPRVDKLFGPGNAYVTAAKEHAQALGTPIDMPAGPSEVLVVADGGADPAFVAADLLSQAEHGPDSQVMLLSDSEALVKAALAALETQLAVLPRRETARQALHHSRAVVLRNLEECMAMSNAYAPEHLILNCRGAKALARSVQHAGSVFLGPYTCETAGDYASGTNHTLPTYGHARSHSGVSLDSFVKQVTFQEITAAGLRTLGPTLEAMAEAEQLQAHREAVSLRLRSLPPTRKPARR